MALAPDRKAQLIATATAYFDGLARKDFGSIPWSDTVVFRGPLGPGGSAVPVVGREAILTLLAALGPNLGDVRVIEHFSMKRERPS